MALFTKHIDKTLLCQKTFQNFQSKQNLNSASLLNEVYSNEQFIDARTMMVGDFRAPKSKGRTSYYFLFAPRKIFSSYYKLKIFNAALLMFSNLACIPTVARVPLRHNTPKIFLQSSKLSINSKVLILNSCKDILLH